MEKQTLLSTLGSVLSAFIGVQSKKKREADFATGNIYMYTVVGFLVTIIFVSGLAWIARDNASQNQHLEGVGTHIVAVKYN
jgi:hypothetical protein